eukprot:6207383-Pyramimonas_sp.AAC.1
MARSVSKTEALVNADAREALRTEWGRLRCIGARDESGVVECDDVIGRRGQNSELPLRHKDRNYKGGVVFDGSDVRDQDKGVALFQELSSSPATMQASKAADAHGLFEGHDPQQFDAEPACAHSRFGGAPAR